MGSESDAQPSAAQIITQLGSLSASNLTEDGKARKTALDLSRKLTATLEGPLEIALARQMSPFWASAVRIAVGMGVFPAIHSADRPMTTSELAKICKAEETFLSRILRLLSGIGAIKEVGPETWSSTPVTAVEATPVMTAGNRILWDIMVEAAVMAPKYLRESGYRAPENPNDGFVQYAHGTKHDVFSYMANSRPDCLQDFNLIMGHTMGGRAFWYDWFPVQDGVIDGTKDGDVQLVDLGGGKGHDLQAFRERFPTAKGKLVLQDLPQALDGIVEGTLDVSIQRMHQDFFEPNKIRGARSYFLHQILHDWPENQCIQILTHLRDAMTPQYSKLLIHDMILPATGVTSFQSGFDMVMMCFNGGMERNQRQWEDLVGKVEGLRIVRFWHAPESAGVDAHGIIEIAKEQ